MEQSFQFEQAVLRDLQAECQLVSGQKVVVAVSGGADSMALLAALRALGSRHRFPLALHVAHLNHGLRGAAADRDAAFVGDMAQRWGLPCVIGRAGAVDPGQGNLEAWARREGHAFLFEHARSVGAIAVATAHTRDDQAETVLLRLTQGSGTRALGGMKMRREDGMIRPLLRTSRADCEAYLRACDISWVHDETNDDLRFLRNRIRHRVLPMLSDELGGHLPARLAAMADDLRIESELAERSLRGALAEHGDSTLSVGAVVGFGQGAARLIHQWLLQQGVAANRRQIEAVVRLATSGGPSAGVDLSGCRVERRYGILVCMQGEPHPAETEGCRSWEVPGSVDLESGWRLTAEQGCGPELVNASPGEVVVDGAGLEGRLTARTVRPGDRIRLRAGTRKLSDVLVDAKIPRIERQGLVVVARGNDIVWVPGLAVSSGLAPGKSTENWMILRPESIDCRPTGAVVQNQRRWVRFR